MPNDKDAKLNTGAGGAKKERNIPRETLITFRRTMFSEKLIGSPEELIPFSWRHPIKIENGKKMSKVLKSMATAEAQRELMVPVLSKNETETE